MEAGSIQVADVVLHETRKFRTTVARTKTRTRPFAKSSNCSLASRFCCPKMAIKSRSTLERDCPILGPTPQTRDSVPGSVGDI